MDIGCAAGDLLKAAASGGWEGEGVEINTVLADAASSSGFKVFRRPVEELGLPSVNYDAVTAFEVFSQMSKPAEAIAAIHHILKPGGILYAREFNAAFHLPLFALEKTWFFGPLGIRPSVLHRFNFRAASLRFMLERAGFHDVRIRNSRPTSGDPYRTGGALGGFLTGLLKVLYYWLAQAVWAVSFGKVFTGSSLIITARK